MSNTTPKLSKPDLLRKTNPKLYNEIATSQCDVMEYLNKRIGQIKMGGKVRFIDREDPMLAFYSKADMGIILGHLTVLDWDGETCAAFKWWLVQEDRRQYSGVVFEPDPKKRIGQALNLFKGFAIKPVFKEGGCAIFYDHLLRNVCGGDVDQYDFLLSMIARWFQLPGDKLGVALVLYGDKGCGKSIVGDILAEIIGTDYCPSVDTPEAISGKHNSHLSTAFLIRAEEALNPRDPRHASRLKHLITGKRLLIEPKGVDAFEIDSKCQVMFTTNNRHVVQASAAERRYYCLHTGNGNLQDRPYFAAMLAEMQAGGYAAFFADMLARPIDTVNFGAPPATALLSTQIVESMTGLEKWWCATLASGRLPFARDPQAEDVDVEWPVGAP